MLFQTSRQRPSTTNSRRASRVSPKTTWKPQRQSRKILYPPRKSLNKRRQLEEKTLMSLCHFNLLNWTNTSFLSLLDLFTFVYYWKKVFTHTKTHNSRPGFNINLCVNVLYRLCIYLEQLWSLQPSQKCHVSGYFRWWRLFRGKQVDITTPNITKISNKDSDRAAPDNNVYLSNT